MKKGLVDYCKDGWVSLSNFVVNLTDWKRVGKVSLAIVPIILFTIWYWVIKWVWNATKYVNKKGDKFFEDFLND